MKNKLLDTFNKLPIVAQIAIVGFAGYGIYRGIKYLSKPRPQQYPLPAGGAGIPTVGYTPTGQPITWNPEPLVDELHDVMDGLFTFSGTKDATWLKLAQLPSNDMVTAVYNRFNQKWGDGDTLTQWIRDEYWTDVAGNGKQSALDRLTSLGLN